MSKKQILTTVISIFMICSLLTACSTYTEVEETTATSITEAATEEGTADGTIIVSDEVSQMAEDTINSDEDLATDETIPADEADEENVFDEGALEADADTEQENISYDGANSGKGLSLLGSCTGLTYYSQADSRWASVMYSSVNDKTQTIKSSGCGPTSAAIIVSSSKGAITPKTMAALFVDNGYRTASNGTAWSAWAFVADYFDFDEYYTTTSDSTMLKYLKKGYYVVASCGSGLFTTGGHYIVLVADNDGVITVYDPYLYSGKFTTASRKAANVTVSGNNVYVTETNFKKYANTKSYWIFSNDYTATSTSSSSTSSSSSTNTSSTKTTSYYRYVATKSSNLNVRSKASSSATIKTTLKKGTKVKVTKTSGSWSYITLPLTGWVSTAYLSSTKVSTTTSTTSYKTKVGTKYRLKSKTTLYSKGSLSGTKYQYLAQTQIKVLKHYSATVDYVQVVKTGRKAYVKVSKFI